MQPSAAAIAYSERPGDYDGTDTFRPYCFESRPHRTAAFSRQARRPPDHSPNLPACNGGHEADHDPGLVQVLDVVAVTQRAGFADDQRPERTSYPQDVKTRHRCLPARRHS